MWDSNSHFTARTSASWCGSATASRSGFLSNRARQSDPGLRRWQSMYNLAHESPARWSPLSGAELRTGGAGSSFYQSEVEQWLQDAHERLNTQLDWLRPRDMKLNYNTSRMQKDAADLSLFDRSRERRELQEKVLKLESDLLQMRSTLDKGSKNQPTGLAAPNSLSRTFPNTQEDIGKEKVDAELREALREAETRATTCEEERNKALEDLRTSEENQRTMRNQIEEMNKRLKSHSEVQEELRETNNKLSRAYLDKTVLSTQVLQLEDNVKELKSKVTEALSANNHLIQEKDDLLLRVQNLEVQLERTTRVSQKSELHHPSANSDSQNNQKPDLMKEDLWTLKEINEKLRKEAEVIRKSLDTSQCQLEELQEERITNSKHVADLQAERSQLIREKKELLSRTYQHEVLSEAKENSCQHRTTADVLDSETQKLRDRCLLLEAQVQQKEKMLQLQEEEHHQQDETRVRCIDELRAVASHWTEKWQNAALSLQSTQNQLEELKKNDSICKRESDSELRAELQKHKEELEQERRRRRTQILLHTSKDKGGQWVDRGTLADSSESSLVHKHPSDSECHQNKPPQVWLESSEIQRLRQKLAEKAKEVNESELALRRLERLREIDKTEAQIRISALELQLMKKAPGDCRDDGGLLADVSGSPSMQLGESRRTGDQLQQDTVQRSQTLGQHSCQDKDQEGPVEGKKDKLIYPVNPETEQQRRLVTEQLKSLFKEREDKTTPAAAQTGVSSPQDWTPTSLFGRAGADRRSWQQSSGLMPVFEEDEENQEEEEEEEDSDSSVEEEEDATEENQAEMSAMTAEISNLKAENLLQALRSKPPIQDPQTAETVLDRRCWEEADSQRRSTRPLYLDGIFLAEMIEICSPGEDEEEQRLHLGVL